MSEDWINGFCACPSMDLCFESCFCPWFTFGRTHDKLKGVDEPSSWNGACLCLALGCLSGFYPVCLILERRRIRKRYNIKGGICGDFWGSVCCVQNVLVQNENEFISRNEMAKTNVVQGGYIGVQGMMYSTPGGGRV
ncbi:PLAC8 family protein [Aspergillus venezuelensis]